MASNNPLPPLRQAPPDLPTLHVRAMDNLRFIRDTMERATAFTAVSGWGLVGMGSTALLAMIIAALQPTSLLWLVTWLSEAALAMGIGYCAIRLKARIVDVPVPAGPARRFGLSLAPSMVVAALLTVALYRADMVSLLPGLWLLLFGVSVVHAGAFSVRVVPFMGLLFMVDGAVALLAPAAWGNWCMGLGFGGLNIVFGLVIARRHGG
jgi:hypothetical protein